MGRHTDPAGVAPRRAVVLTLTACALLVCGGFVVAAEAGDRAQLRPARPSSSTAVSVPSTAPGTNATSG